MKITLVCEHNPGMDTPEGRAAYPEGMAECLAGIFSEGNEVTLLAAPARTAVPDLTDEHPRRHRRARLVGALVSRQRGRRACR